MSLSLSTLTVERCQSTGTRLIAEMPSARRHHSTISSHVQSTPIFIKKNKL
jgi:hypothetical protein